MATGLKAFQVRLHSDKALRAKFLKDPVKALEAAGLRLSAATKKRLITLAAQLATKPRRKAEDKEAPRLTIYIEPKRR
jgi:hypothetical protein